MSEPILYRFSDNRKCVSSDAEFYYFSKGYNDELLTVRLHTHDYYELEFISSGKCCNTINGKPVIMEAGDLTFIRDTDVHRIDPVEGGYYNLHNIAFSKDIFSRLMYFLGDSYDFGELFTSTYPSVVHLSPIDSENLVRRMKVFNANLSKDKKLVDKAGKELLFKVMISYFCPADIKNPVYKKTPPKWFADMCSKMDLTENWQKGTARMCELSGRSSSHISHSMKRYLDTTPTEFINERRLRYAKQLLLKSDFPIIDICISAGFENESWFYKKFKERYGMTPDRYRKEHK